MKKSKVVILMVIFCFSFSSCLLSGRSTAVNPKSGNLINLPECKDRVSKEANIRFSWDVRNEHSGTVEIGAQIRFHLQGLAKTYSMQSENLCRNASVYIGTGNERGYLCRLERLDNAYIELFAINQRLNGLKTTKNPDQFLSRIYQLIEAHNNRYFSMLNTPCSTPAPPIKNSEIESLPSLPDDGEGSFFKIIELSNDIELAYKKMESNQKIKEIEAELEKEKTRFRVIEEREARLKGGVAKNRNIDIRAPAAPTNFRIQ